MVDAGSRADILLRELIECPICMTEMTDSRFLPCMHTFCFECLRQTADAEHKKPEEKLPCPVCRTEFIIPADGMKALRKNFNMANLQEVKRELHVHSETIICDACVGQKEHRTATMKCLECQNNYCDDCAKVHQFQKMRTDHEMVHLGSDMKSERKELDPDKACPEHMSKSLDFYCTKCKRTVCVSCFVESHQLHYCRDVVAVAEIFRREIKTKQGMVSFYMNEMELIRKNEETIKTDFLEEIFETEREIHNRNQELKDMIDRHTKSLLCELSAIKTNYLIEIANEMEEIERSCTILSSFEAYCTELVLKGSARKICSSFDKVIVQADEFERNHEAFIGRPHHSVDVRFQATDVGYVAKNATTNLVGHVEETATQFETFAVVFGLHDGPTKSNDVARINLHRPNEVLIQESIPTRTAGEAVAAVYCNTVYIAGIGDNFNEIWKYNSTSGWLKRASLFQGRRRHSAAFVDDTLYICGGFVDSHEIVLDVVEAYNATTSECTVVGTLLSGVHSSGNCVPFKGSLYIFGGIDKDKTLLNCVQVYNTEENTCSLLQQPMPCAHSLMKAVLWETSVILFGRFTCLIVDLETETWEEREQFKTDVVHFGLVVDNERVFVIGGGIGETDEDGKTIWKCRDDVRCIPIQNIVHDRSIDWKIHGKLPKPCLVQAFEKHAVSVLALKFGFSRYSPTVGNSSTKPV